MANIIIVHGTGGSPEGNWFPWLKKELEKLGHEVYVPRFPTPKNQSLQSWLETFKPYEQYLNTSCIVVGHSLGPAFLLTVLEQQQKPIKAAFFVAGFTGLLGNKEFDNLNKSFTTRQFDWNKIRSHCKKFYVIYADNDPYVPLQRGKDLAKKLDASFMVLPGAGHINEEFGYTSCEFLLEKIVKEL